MDVVNPPGLIWVVVGDRGRIKAGIRELGLGEIVSLDADGNVLDEPVAAPANAATGAHPEAEPAG